MGTSLLGEEAEDSMEEEPAGLLGCGQLGN